MSKRNVAFCILYSRSATWWCQNQPQSFSHRKPPAQESLERFWVPAFSKKFFGTRTICEREKRRNKEDPKRQNTFRTHSEHHTIIRYSSDIYGSYNSAGGQWLVHTAMRSGLGPDHVSSRRTAMAVSGCPHVVLRARWVWLGLPAKKALWKLWKSWK